MFSYQQIIQFNEMLQAFDCKVHHFTWYAPINIHRWVLEYIMYIVPFRPPIIEIDDIGFLSGTKLLQITERYQWLSAIPPVLSLVVLLSIVAYSSDSI